jgi:hypothetical protein
MRRPALSGSSASAWSGVRPLGRSAGIMAPVPLWRFAPFRAPAAFDVNLCTDSVLPGTIAPVRLRCAWVLWPLLSSIPYKFQTLEFRMGPFPTLASQQHSSILTGLIASLAGFALLRGLHLVCAAGEIPGRKPRLLPPKTHCLRLLPAVSWDFAKKNMLREPHLFTKGMRADAAKDSVLPEPPTLYPSI